MVTQTTVGSNVEHVLYKKTQLQIWDLGGQQALRPFWATYYKGADAVIMVSHVGRWERCRDVLIFRLGMGGVVTGTLGQRTSPTLCPLLFPSPFSR